MEWKKTEGYKKYLDYVGGTFDIRKSFFFCPYYLNPFSRYSCPDVTMYDEEFGKYLLQCSDDRSVASVKGWVDFKYLKKGEYELRNPHIRSTDYQEFLNKCREAEIDYMA